MTLCEPALMFRTRLLLWRTFSLSVFCWRVSLGFFGRRWALRANRCGMCLFPSLRSRWWFLRGFLLFSGTSPSSSLPVFRISLAGGEFFYLIFVVSAVIDPLPHLLEFWESAVPAGPRRETDFEGHVSSFEALSVSEFHFVIFDVAVCTLDLTLRVSALGRSGPSMESPGDELCSLPHGVT